MKEPDPKNSWTEEKVQANPATSGTERPDNWNQNPEVNELTAHTRINDCSKNLETEVRQGIMECLIRSESTELYIYALDRRHCIIAGECVCLTSHRGLLLVLTVIQTEGLPCLDKSTALLLRFMSISGITSCFTKGSSCFSEVRGLHPDPAGKELGATKSTPVGSHLTRPG